MDDRDHWGWRQNLTRKFGFRRAQTGDPYFRLRWANKRGYERANLHGKDMILSEEAEPLPPFLRPIPDALPKETAPQESRQAEWERLMRELRDLSR